MVRWFLILIQLATAFSGLVIFTAVTPCPQTIAATDEFKDTEEEIQARVAYERFLSMLRKQPRPGIALDRVIEFHGDRGTLEQFVGSLRELAASAEDQGVSWLLLGLIEQQQTHESEAAAAFREAESLRDNDPLASWYLGQSLIRLGQATAAAEALERAIQKSPNKNDLMQIFHELGRAYRRSQQPERSAEIWSRMEKQFPNDLRVKEQIATTLQEEGDFDAALIRLTELATLHKDLDQAVQFALKAGELKQHLGRTKEALSDFETQLSKLDPDSWLFRETRRRIEDVFLQNDDLIGMVSYYEGWLKSHPEDLDAMSRIGRALTNLDRSSEARVWYSKALALAPSSVPLREALIEQLIREQQFKEAIAQYEQLRQYDNGNPDHVEAWGLLFLNRHDLPVTERQTQAASVWRILLDDRPNDPGTAVRVAELLRRAELTDEAVELYRKAISLAPKDPQYREYLGEYLYFLKRTDEAIAVWNSIAEGKSRTTENFVRLAEVLQNHGEKSRALDAMKEACALRPEFADRVRYSEMLREFKQDGRQPYAEESLQQLDMAEAMAESAEDQRRVLNERIRSLTISGLLEQKTQILAAELQKGHNATTARWQTLALYYDAANELPLAIESIRRSLAIEPESVTSWTVAADLYEKTGRNADAADAIRRLVTLDHRSRAEYLKKIATLEQKLGRFKAAQQAGKDLIALAPGNPEHLQFYADLCFHAGQKDEGLAALRRAARSNASDEGALLSLAQALQNQLETTEAIDLYWRAFERTTDPDTRMSVITSLAELHLRTNQFDRLVQKLELRGRKPDLQRESIMALATAFRIAGDLPSSRKQLERLITADSRDVALLAELSKLTEEEGELDAAANYQRRILSTVPSRESQLRLSDLLRRLGDINEADALLTSVNETQAGPHEVIRLIDQLISMENIDSAKQVCVRTLDKEPANWEAIVRLGLLEWKTGEKDKAAELFEQLLALHLDPDAPSAETVWNQTTQKPSGSSQSLSSQFGWPPSLSRGDKVYGVVALLEESAHSDFGPRNGHRWSDDQIARLMPVDYGEARIFCLAAKLLKARDEQRVPALLIQLEAAADSSLQSAWDVLHAHRLSAVIDKALWQDERLEIEKTLQHLTRLARANAADAQLLYLLICEDALKSGRFDRETEQRNASSSSGADPSRSVLSSDQTDLLIMSFESVLASHPTWLAEFDLSTLLTACRQTETVESIDSLVGRLSREQSSHWQLAAALNLALLRSTITAEDALKLLDRIVLLARESHVLDSDLDAAMSRWLRTLNQIARQSSAKSDLESVLKTLDWWLTLKAADLIRGKPVVVSGQVLAAAQEVITRTISMDKDVGRGVMISEPMSVTQRRLTAHRISVDDFRYLSEIDTSFFQAGRHDELLNWCRDRRVEADARTVLCLDTAQALFCMEHEYVPEAVVHLIRAVETVPDDVLLRLSLVELTESLGQKADALALLDQLPDSDPALLKAREIKALDLSLKVNDMGRARLAAERLYGLQLDPTSQAFLISKLSRLGLQDMAAQIKNRTRPVNSVTQSLSPLELLERYEKQSNTQAAVQIAQQLIRRTSPLVVAPLSRFSGKVDQDKIRSRAFKFLKESGELDQMIAQQRTQLEKSPNSSVLLQTLVEYLEVAGKHDEVDLIRERMIAQLPKDSAESLFGAARQLEAAGRKGEACDKLLELLQKHPRVFWERYDDFEELFMAEQRIGEVVDAFINGGPAKLSGNLGPEIVERLIERLAEDASSFPLVAKLLDQAITAYPDFLTGFVNSVKDHQSAWQTPEMFEVLCRLYVPASSREARKPRLGWVDARENSEDPHGLTMDYNASESGLAILFGALSSPDRRAEFRERVTAAQQAFPEWPAAEMLLILAELKSDNGNEESERLIRLWSNNEARPIPEQVAHDVASLLAENHRFKPLAIELLQASVSRSQSGRSQSGDINFLRPAALLLNRLYAETGRHDEGRRFILQHLAAESEHQPNSDSQQLRAIGSRLAAANALIAMNCPLEALQAISVLTQKDEHRYRNAASNYGYRSYRRQPSDRALVSIRTDAARALTPLAVAIGLQSTLNRTETDERPWLDFALLLNNTQGNIEQLHSVLLEGLSNPLNGGSNSAELQQLSNSLEAAMQQQTADPSLIIVGVDFILNSRDEKVIAQIIPGLGRYLSRPVPELSELKALSSDDLRRREAEMSLACVASMIKDRSGLKPLVGQMLDRSIAIARQHPNPRYLSALLYKRGEILNAMGDRQAAEESWSELLELVLAESDPMTGSRETRSVPNSPLRPAVDIGAELRKNLLKMSP